MISRVSEQMRFNMLVNNLVRIQVSTDKVLEQISSQKKVNRPSDDPVGMGKILDYRNSLSSIEQYKTNIDNANTWATMTETCLEDIKDLITQAKQIGMDFTNDEQKTAQAESIRQIMEAIMASANTKLGNRYLFSGSMTDTQPFSDVTDPTLAAGGYAFNGQALLGGVFTENANKDYLVEIVNGGTLGTATYRISSDGGATWGTTSTIPVSGTIDLTDSADVDGGLSMTFVDDGTTGLTTGDQFTVHAYTSAGIGAAVAAKGNTYAGTVTSGTGPYTGTENKTYAVKITGAGGLGVATYSYSSDGGTTWTAGGTVPAGGTATLAEGVTLNFTAGTFAVNDMFYADAKAPGFYNGNGEDLTLDIGQGKNVSMSYNISGEEAFTDRGTGTGFPDVFASLKGLAAAIQNGDEAGVEQYVNQLSEDQTHISTIITKLGFKEQTYATWKDTYTTLDNKISDLKSNIEDTDMTKMVADYKMKETALEAAYTIASKIGSMSILDYLQ